MEGIDSETWQRWEELLASYDYADAATLAKAPTRQPAKGGTGSKKNVFRDEDYVDLFALASELRDRLRQSDARVVQLKSQLQENAVQDLLQRQNSYAKLELAAKLNAEVQDLREQVQHQAQLLYDKNKELAHRSDEHEDLRAQLREFQQRMDKVTLMLAAQARLTERQDKEGGCRLAAQQAETMRLMDELCQCRAELVSSKHRNHELAEQAADVQKLSEAQQYELDALKQLESAYVAGQRQLEALRVENTALSTMMQHALADLQLNRRMSSPSAAQGITTTAATTAAIAGTDNSLGWPAFPPKHTSLLGPRPSPSLPHTNRATTPSRQHTPAKSSKTPPHLLPMHPRTPSSHTKPHPSSAPAATSSRPRTPLLSTLRPHPLPLSRSPYTPSKHTPHKRGTMDRRRSSTRTTKSLDNGYPQNSTRGGGAEGHMIKSPSHPATLLTNPGGSGGREGSLTFSDWDRPVSAASKRRSTGTYGDDDGGDEDEDEDDGAGEDESAGARRPLPSLRGGALEDESSGGVGSGTRYFMRRVGGGYSPVKVVSEEEGERRRLRADFDEEQQRRRWAQLTRLLERAYCREAARNLARVRARYRQQVKDLRRQLNGAIPLPRALSLAAATSRSAGRTWWVKNSVRVSKGPKVAPVSIASAVQQKHKVRRTGTLSPAWADSPPPEPAVKPGCLPTDDGVDLAAQLWRVAHAGSASPEANTRQHKLWLAGGGERGSGGGNGGNGVTARSLLSRGAVGDSSTSVEGGGGDSGDGHDESLSWTEGTEGRRLATAVYSRDGGGLAVDEVATAANGAGSPVLQAQADPRDGRSVGGGRVVSHQALMMMEEKGVGPKTLDERDGSTGRDRGQTPLQNVLEQLLAMQSFRVAEGR